MRQGAPRSTIGHGQGDYEGALARHQVVGVRGLTVPEVRRGERLPRREHGAVDNAAYYYGVEASVARQPREKDGGFRGKGTLLAVMFATCAKILACDVDC